MAHYDGFRESADAAADREAKRKNVRPSRMKFASLVGKLDPLDENYSAVVNQLHSEHNQREELITRLCEAVESGDNIYAAFDGDIKTVGSFSDAIRAAVERWVVDNRP